MESMENFEKELENSFRKINVGDVLQGTVISISEEEVIVDLNYYTQGVVRREDLSNDEHFNPKEEMNIGDEIQATVIREDDGHGNILLSCREAADELSWDKLKKMMLDNEAAEVTVKECVNGGVVTYIEGLRAFIPASQISDEYVEDTAAWKNRKLTVKITEVDRSKNKIVLSAKAVIREQQNKERNDKISQISPDAVLEGVVERLAPYGAFINLGDGLTGLVHISQICSKHIGSPKEVLKEGDHVTVKVISTAENKISLSMKALEELPVPEDEEEETEPVEYLSGTEVGTGLGSLLANLFKE